MIEFVTSHKKLEGNRMKKGLTAVILTVLTLLASASISIQSAQAASLVTVIVDGEK